MKRYLGDQVALEMNHLLKNETFTNKLGLPKKIASKENCCNCDGCSDECSCKECKNDCAGCTKISSKSFDELFDTVIKVSSILEELGCKRAGKTVLSALDMMISEAAIKNFTKNSSVPSSALKFRKPEEFDEQELLDISDKLDEQIRKEKEFEKNEPEEHEESEDELVHEISENENENIDRDIDSEELLRKIDEEEDGDDFPSDILGESPESGPQGFFHRNYESHGLRGDYDNNYIKDDVNDISDKLEKELQELEKLMPELSEHANGIRSESPPGKDIIPDSEDGHGEVNLGWEDWLAPTIYPKQDYTSPPLSHAELESIHLPEHKILTEEDFLDPEDKLKNYPDNDYGSESEVPNVKRLNKKKEFKYNSDYDDDEIKVAFSNLDQWLKKAENKMEDEDDDEDFEDE